ncbi:uncharacterized protein LOC144145470 isoform X2 [Haemaphysalis longicornis]
MIPRFCLLIVCIFTPIPVKAETCGGSSGPPCNISLVYTAFKSAHLVAITPNWEYDVCIFLVPHENNTGTTIDAYYKNGTFGSRDIETYTFTDAPDVVNVSFDFVPGELYQFQMLYADFQACFIVNFNPEFIGCRLWIFDNATREQITACTKAHAKACSGTIHDTWDEDACDRFLERS